MTKPLQIDNEKTPHQMAFRLAAGYAVLGMLWIISSEAILGWLGFPEPLESALEAAKGVLFVLVTASVLYAFSRAGVSRVQGAQRELHDQETKIRQAYVDVLDAVTGGRLVLVTEDEMAAELGDVLASGLLESSAQLADIRRRIEEASEGRLSPETVAGALSAVGEALNNALKHAGTGHYEVLSPDHTVQVKVSDHGPGIDFRTLPKATLVPGFSTAQTLGMGFTIMLQLADRVLICTRPGSTSVLLEFTG
jgi:anti-sigma regulatory factor (Ser/Thr protein kinase)